MMPILARFRQGYEEATLPLGRVCARAGITPNMLTYASVVCSMGAGYAIASQLYLLGIAIILLVGLTDMLDGATARATATSTSYGTVLDHVSDRYAEFFLFIGVLYSGAVQPIWVVFALFGMIMASYVRARAESTGKVESCNVGFAGRQEKLVLLVVGLFIQAFAPTSIWLELAVIMIGLLSHITAIQRLAYARRILLDPNSRREWHNPSEPV